MKTLVRCLPIFLVSSFASFAQPNTNAAFKRVRFGLDMSKSIVNLFMFRSTLVAEPTVYFLVGKRWDLALAGSYVRTNTGLQPQEYLYCEGFGLKIGPEYHFDQTWFAGARLMGTRFVEHRFVRLEGPYFGDYVRDLVPLRRRFVGGLELNGGAYFPIGNLPLYGRVEARLSLLHSDEEPAMTYAPAVGWVGAKGLVPSGGISFLVVFPR